jgi:uncharacterized protein (TIGR02466 family)
MNAEILPLFSTPIYVADTGIISFEKEIEFLKQFEYEKAINNQISKETKMFQYTELCNIKSICENHLQQYVQTVLNCRQEIYITNSWTTRNSSGDSHHIHYHQNSIISGVIYLQVPNKDNAITFHHKSALKKQFEFEYSIDEYNIFNSDTWKVPIKQGEIILFPSWLNHSVNVNESNTDRIVLGFNTFARGKFGEGAYSGDIEL